MKIRKIVTNKMKTKTNLNVEFVKIWVMVLNGTVQIGVS